MQKSIFLTFTSLGFAAAGRFASAHYSDDNSMTMNFGYNYWGWFGWVFMLVCWVLIVALIVVAIRWLLFRSKDVLSERRTALDILKEHYARGEIDKEEFDEKKKALS